MENRGNKITVRIIAVIGIVYNMIVIAGGLYAAHAFYPLTHVGNYSIDNPVINNAIGYATLIALAGILGLIDCIGLLWIKKWGFYLFYISIIATYFLYWMKPTISLGSWIELIILTIITLIVIFQQRILFRPVAAALNS